MRALIKASYFGDRNEDLKVFGPAGNTRMSGALSGGGLDAKRDIAGITVNRWPHGYAYNELFDDPSFGPDKGPHIEARKRMGRISIANSDASAYAYVDGAIDAAHRAVMEQLGG